MPGFLYGTAAATTGTASPFTFGLPKTTAPTFGQSNPAGAAPTAGFSFGLNKTTATTGLLGRLAICRWQIRIVWVFIHRLAYEMCSVVDPDNSCLLDCVF